MSQTIDEQTSRENTQGARIPRATYRFQFAPTFTFARQHERDTMLVVVPRLVSRLILDPATAPLGAKVWGDTRIILPQMEGLHDYRNLFTGETVALSDAKANLRSGRCWQRSQSRC